ncbi:MAG TPA: xanthine dehydrogenase family protein molybdopterin-binding subunit [Candidatus Acidoferrales bacterium]|nr:xanthine dehydrogenase family protein molybdopterin-binding subunit [Candidatus Acidoferrales bacterium]
MADIKWPAPADRHLIGKRISRIDGPFKSSGRAKYTFDINRPNMLFGKMVLSAHAHAKIDKIDTGEAEGMPGVRAVYTMVPEGQEVNWVGQEVVALAADTEEQAEEAADHVHIDYSPLPFLVADTDPQQAGPDRTKQLRDQSEGDPQQGFQQAEVTHEGAYGIPVITHCCLESHGSVAEWNGDKLNVWLSTQNVSGSAGQYSDGLKQAGINVAPSDVSIDCQYMGGGFGSKFGPDSWGIAAAVLARKAGRPVKMMLERDHELLSAGCRPSLHGRIKVGAKKDGTLVAWDSESWGTGGMGSAGTPPLPYIFKIPNQHVRHSAVLTNIGPARAWRAPNHPQVCFLTMTALDDLAAKLGMDPLDFFLKNIGITGPRSANYQEELLRAADMIAWKKNWHPRGDRATGPVKRGLGLSIHTWGGAGHVSNCRCTIQPDGSVEVALGSQDLGTGTRTVIDIVAAETLGLPLEGVQVAIGDNKYPPDGASGGSTTVGGVSSSTRVAATNALNQLLEKVAPSLNATPDQLEAVGGRIQVRGDSARSIPWKQACAKLGAAPIVAMGQRDASLISAGVGGAQMAQVAVDTETGVVRMEKIVAVQDCGLVIDPKTAESQVYGACIMGTCYALHEEKIMDDQTGACLNPNMEFYRLSGIDDIGEIQVHMMTGPGYDERGVIGLGEPPVVSPGAAISNAVANAIGARVPDLPITPNRVLMALGKGGAV